VATGTWAKKLPLLLLLWALPAVAPAQFTYTTNNDGSLNLSDYTGSAGSVVIPNTTNGLPVTSIGDAAFFESASLTNVTIGTNVASIGGQAFSYSSLAAVTLPGSVTNLAFDAFFDCNSLTAINVSTNNPIYSSVAGVLFNESQTTLVEYPEGKADGYIVPDSVTNIETDAFFDCTNLTSVSLPASVVGIGDYAFYACSALTAITVNTNNPVYSSVAGVLFNENQTTLIQYPAGNAATSYAMPNSVTNIAIEAFYGSASLVSVTIGTNVNTVGPASFEYCPALASVTLPDSVAQIEGDAFAECYSLTNLAIGAGVTNIESQAFLDCTSLLAISVATNNPVFTSVGGVLFNRNQTTLFQYPAGSSGTLYVIPNSVTRIQDDAFTGSYSLTSITIGTNVLSIGDGAFSQCYNLARITLPNSLTNLSFSTFFDCLSLTNVTIGSGITTLGFQDFASCDSLAGIYFLGNAPGVDADVFDNDSAAIVYYLPGTTGWNTQFDGLPTALWLPSVQTGDASFGAQVDGFGFTINWANGQTVVVQASTNLLSPVWSPVGTNVFAGASSVFRDTQWTNYSRRFYRLSSP
jgi:hypothetical protein